MSAETNTINIIPFTLGFAAAGAGIGAVTPLVDKPYLYDGIPTGDFKHQIQKCMIDEGDKFIKNDETFTKISENLKELSSIKDKATMDTFIKSGKAGKLDQKIVDGLIKSTNVDETKTIVEILMKHDKEYAFNSALSKKEGKSIIDIFKNYKEYVDKLSDASKKSIEEARKSVLKKEIFKTMAKDATIAGGVAALVGLIFNGIIASKNKKN